MKKIVFILIAVSFSLSAFSDEDTAKTTKGKSSGSVKVEIGKKGFKAEKPLNFAQGENIVLDIKRTTKKTCMTEIKHPKTGKVVDLPLNKETRLDLGSYQEAKEIKLLCGMNMTAGIVHVK